MALLEPTASTADLRKRADAIFIAVEKVVADDLHHALKWGADKVDALQAFKDFVHNTLDKMGVPKDPPGPHKDAGCRVGQRLEWIKENGYIPNG